LKDLLIYWEGQEENRNIKAAKQAAKEILTNGGFNHEEHYL